MNKTLIAAHHMIGKGWYNGKTLHDELPQIEKKDCFRIVREISKATRYTVERKTEKGTISVRVLDIHAPCMSKSRDTVTEEESKESKLWRLAIFGGVAV